LIRISKSRTVSRRASSKLKTTGTVDFEILNGTVVLRAEAKVDAFVLRDVAADHVVVVEARAGFEVPRLVESQAYWM